MTIWRMCVTCFIPKATNPHSQYAILSCFPTATMVARTHLFVAFYVHPSLLVTTDILCCKVGAVLRDARQLFVHAFVSTQ